MRFVLSTFALALFPVLTGCAGEVAPEDATEGTEEAAVQDISLEELARSNALRRRVERQNELWGDENIMNGAVSVVARKVDPGALGQLERIGRIAFGEGLREDDVSLEGEATSARGDDGTAKEAARRIALEGFVYEDSAENVTPVERSVKRLVDALGPAADRVSIVVEGRVKVESSGDDETWRASAFVFANKTTGELIVFYARQGWV